MFHQQLQINFPGNRLESCTCQWEIMPQFHLIRELTKMRPMSRSCQLIVRAQVVVTHNRFSFHFSLFIVQKYIHSNMYLELF